ncbi:hypothetical protein PAXRUDRAFT_29054 [Paxillus rubicundulus Ve08.2h10]|uniref:Uncharacterized protein n=1 Tax=Paxillus rubicundulus Ve08.2h10 TaxID=930991 RepID=A0A0D0DE23_9AGAM|nr:hypothetical protein PAXRUDRAFT_29054 [Paxillus rubicundulus Ve08.2h10]
MPKHHKKTSAASDSKVGASNAASLSTPPVKSQAASLSQDVSTQGTAGLTVAGACKQAGPEGELLVCTASQTKQQCRANSFTEPAEQSQVDTVSMPTPVMEPVLNFGLEPIYEALNEDEINFCAYADTQPEWQAQLSHPGDLIGSIVNYDDTSLGEESHMKEDQALVNRNPDSSSDGSDDDDDFKRLLQLSMKTKPVQHKRADAPAMKKSKSSSGHSNADFHPDSDEEFNIKCVVHISKSSSSLLDISSTITFKELHEVVAKRLK